MPQKISLGLGSMVIITIAMLAIVAIFIYHEQIQEEVESLIKRSEVVIFKDI